VLGRVSGTAATFAELVLIVVKSKEVKVFDISPAALYLLVQFIF
jgi:hypothetical protein